MTNAPGPSRAKDREGQPSSPPDGPATPSCGSPSEPAGVADALASTRGTPIVLTADRTLIARYDVLLDGMMAASQTTTTPGPLMDALLMRRAGVVGGRAEVGPLGLRRIEAALLQGGFTPQQVCLTDDRHLPSVVGPETRVIGISSGEPLGLGMSSSTMAGVAGGAIYPEVMFRRLAHMVRRLVTVSAPSAKVVLGGPGAWQLAEAPAARRELGIDHLVLGYAEGNVAEVFRSLMAGEQLPAVIVGQGVPAAEIPPIRGQSSMGVIEISRGCGLGCRFCTIAGVPMGHLPVETILADAQTNLVNGPSRSIAVLSEDFFRYGAEGIRCRPEALLQLLQRLRELPGLGLIQADHANVLSISQYEDRELSEVYRLMVGDAQDAWPWVNVGVETASGDLLKANGGAAKMGDIAPANWGTVAAEQLRRLSAAGFIPMASLVVGLPGETRQDVAQTLDWVRSLRGERLTVFPVIFAPVRGDEPPARSDLTKLHWQLVRECYEMNFRWMPLMYWGNQTAAGVSLGRRRLFQCLGKGQVVLWKTLLAVHRWRAPR